MNTWVTKPEGARLNEDNLFLAPERQIVASGRVRNAADQPANPKGRLIWKDGKTTEKKVETTRKILDTWKEEGRDNDGQQPHTATFPLRLRVKWTL